MTNLIFSSFLLFFSLFFLFSSSLIFPLSTNFLSTSLSKNAKLVKICPISDCVGVCVQIQSLTVNPPSGRVGSKFEFDLQFTVFNKTGTGEIDLEIQPASGMPLGAGELVPLGYEPGESVAECRR